MPRSDPIPDPETLQPGNAIDLLGEDYDDDEDDAIEEDDEDEDEDEEDEDENDDVLFEPATPRAVKLKMDTLVRRMLTGPVPIHVHNVIIKGNTKTKGYIIETQASEALKKATTMQDLLRASDAVNSRLKSLGLFDSVAITLDSGPPEIPGSVNVIIKVEEARNRVPGEIGAYTNAEAKSSSVEGSINYKNLLGFGDLWDGSIAYGFDRTAEVSVGVYLPRLKTLVAPLTVRAYLLTQDLLTFSSYKERSVGLSLGLFSNRFHNLEYHLAWRYAFIAKTHIGGLAPDSQSLRFLRQEFDLRCAIPVGFYHAALNFGICSGVIFPWGSGFLNRTTSIPERFFLGGNLSPVCALGGPKALWGFKTRATSSYESKRQIDDENADVASRDSLGGNFTVTALADLSFDLPTRWFRERGIHAHVFAYAGNVAMLTENEFRSFSMQKFIGSFRSSAGIGIVIPTNRFRMELNYCYILKKFANDHAKAGFWLTFSRPS
ncbi:Outer membrane OMP85 family protein isoform 1 [Gossypium australe]|uniref:Outer membrane OMP85 family protein isoform 1 n=1 Tax=Gossypium australe TaxID=47621 RepID=A0A5B6VEU4_9ROSI|nr:Outer membrane OMP85 family protein isoform 1 [Gossypium australe]